MVAEERKMASFTFNKTIDASKEIRIDDVDEKEDPLTFGQD